MRIHYRPPTALLFPVIAAIPLIAAVYASSGDMPGLSGAGSNPYLKLAVDPSPPIATGAGNFSAQWNSWVAANATVSVSGGMLSGIATSNDPNIRLSSISNGPDLDLGWNDFIEVRLKVPVRFNGEVKIFYGTTPYRVAAADGSFVTADTGGFSPLRVITIPASKIVPDGAFHTYRMDLGLEPAWRETLTDLRIDITGGSVASGTPFAIDYLSIGDEPNEIVYQPRYTTECPAPGGKTPSGARIGAGAAVSSMESKHFRFLWNTADVAEPSWTLNMPHGTLRNLEEAWQVHLKLLGYHDPSLAWGTTTGTRYKLNVTSWYGGYWAGGDTFEDATLSRLNITPDGLRVDPPTWVIPHELMHCFQFYNNGGRMPHTWFEFHANYGRERWLETYQNLYPNASGIDPTFLRCAHQVIGSGRDYYLCWPIFLYIDENPDKLPGLGEGTVARIWQQTRFHEYPLMTLQRIAPATSLKDIVGGYARREVTFNYPSKAAIQASLAGFHEPLDNVATERWQFTDLVQRSDDPTWWRVPYEMAPMQGAYAIHELLVSGSGNAGRRVTVNFHGLPDSARGADWRASFIVIADDGSERYSNLWGNGVNSVTLAPNENKLYLSVAGAPDRFYNPDFDENVCPYRSDRSKARFPYEMQVFGATPRERDNGPATGLIQVANGGGYRAGSAHVAASAFVGPNARVLGNASVSDNAHILDYAVVSDSARVSGNAIVSGHGWVRGNAVVTGNAKVRDWALVEGGVVTGFARILEHANIKGGLVTDIATAKGTAASLTGTLSGNAIIDGDMGDFFSGRNVNNAIAFGFLPYVGVPDSFLRPLPPNLYASYDFATPHDSRILDQYGVTDGFTLGSPAWIATDGKRKGFLQFNGINQAVALDRSVCDIHAFTFAACVKPLGGYANQALLWMGTDAARHLCFTPNDGLGHSRFSITNNGMDQILTARALPLNVWTQVAVTLDGYRGVLYLNGVPAAVTAISTLPDQLLAPNTSTGRQQDYLAGPGARGMFMYRGALANVQFYAAALTPDAIAALEPITSPIISGSLYVDLRASDLSEGSDTWINHGAAGDFLRTGAPSLVANVLGTGIPGVQFSGTGQAYTSSRRTTPVIDGHGSRTIEVWALNPSLSDEESMVSWGYRGTPESDMSFNWGSASGCNAATHWGDDLAWSTIPSSGTWHYVVYTYDGNRTASVYVDGILDASRTLNAVLSTFPSQLINIACQRDSAGGDRDKFFSGYINSIRVQSGVLTPAQIHANYDLGPYRSLPFPAATSRFNQ
jgi:hypothetical protein